MSRRKQERPKHLAYAKKSKATMSAICFGGEAQLAEAGKIGGNAREVNGSRSYAECEQNSPDFRDVDCRIIARKNEPNDQRLCPPADEESDTSSTSSSFIADNRNLLVVKSSQAESEAKFGVSSYMSDLADPTPPLPDTERATHMSPAHVDESQRNCSKNVGDTEKRRFAESDCYDITVESHVNKLQSFVDSLAKNTEPIISEMPVTLSSMSSFIARNLRNMPVKTVGSISSLTSGAIRSPFSNYATSLARDSLVSGTTESILGSTEQPLDLSTKKSATGSNVEDSFLSDHHSIGIASLETQRRRSRKTEMSSKNLFRGYGLSHNDSWLNSSKVAQNKSCSSSTFSTTGNFFSEAEGLLEKPDGLRRRVDRNENPFKELLVDVTSPSGKTENSAVHGISSYRKKSRSSHLNQSHSTQEHIAPKSKNFESDGILTIERRECHMQPPDALLKCSNFLSHNSRASELTEDGREETEETRRQECSEFTRMRCSCGTAFESLYQLAVHIEQSDHVPESLRSDSMSDLPKLVRGQDVWMSQGREHSELILRCVQCRNSFQSLPELTVHMIRTKHYVNIIGANETQGQSSLGEKTTEAGDQKDDRMRSNSPVPCDSDLPTSNGTGVCEKILATKTVDNQDDIQERLGLNKAYWNAVLEFGDYNLAFQPKFSRDFSSSSNNELGRVSVEDETDKSSWRQKAKNSKHLKAPQGIILGDDKSYLTAGNKEALSGRLSSDPSLTKVRTHESIKHSARKRNSTVSRLHSKISVTSSSSDLVATSAPESSDFPVGSDARNDAKRSSVEGKVERKELERLPEPLVQRNFERKDSKGSFHDTESSDSQLETKLSPFRGYRSAEKTNESVKIRSKRPAETDTENENTDKQCGEKPRNETLENQPPLRKLKSQNRECHSGNHLSSNDLRKKEMISGVSRWIASLDTEASDVTWSIPPEDTDTLRIGSKLELVSPPPEPVDSASTLMAIKNFVEKSFSTQSHVPGLCCSSLNISSGAEFSTRNIAIGKGNYPFCSNPLSIKGEIINSPHRGSPMKRRQNGITTKDLPTPNVFRRKHMKANKSARSELGIYSSAANHLTRDEYQNFIEDLRGGNDIHKRALFCRKFESDLTGFKHDQNEIPNSRYKPSSGCFSEAPYTPDGKPSSGPRTGLAAVQSETPVGRSNEIPCDLPEADGCAEVVTVVPISYDKSPTRTFREDPEKHGCLLPIRTVSTSSTLPGVDVRDGSLDSQESASEPIHYLQSSIPYARVY